MISEQTICYVIYSIRVSTLMTRPLDKGWIKIERLRAHLNVLVLSNLGLLTILILSNLSCKNLLCLWLLYILHGGIINRGGALPGMLNDDLLADGASRLAFGPFLYLKLDHAYLLSHFLIGGDLFVELFFEVLDAFLECPLLLDELELAVVRLELLLPQEVHHALH